MHQTKNIKMISSKSLLKYLRDISSFSAYLLVMSQNSLSMVSAMKMFAYAGAGFEPMLVPTHCWYSLSLNSKKEYFNNNSRSLHMSPFGTFELCSCSKIFSTQLTPSLCGILLYQPITSITISIASFESIISLLILSMDLRKAGVSGK